MRLTYFIIWFLIILIGAVIGCIAPIDFKYSVGFFAGCLSFVFLRLAIT